MDLWGSLFTHFLAVPWVSLSLSLSFLLSPPLLTQSLAYTKKGSHSDKVASDRPGSCH